MIVLDGSALFAILLGEAEAHRCAQVLEQADPLLLSAGSLAELLIAAAGKDVLDEMQRLVAGLDPAVVPLTEPRARAAAEAYRKWGKGFHRAKLNLGDSFAYALAREHDCPLLFVGDDFAKTDIASALA